MCYHQNVADLLEGFRQEFDSGHLQFERRQAWVTGSPGGAAPAYLDGPRTEFHPHRIKRDEHGGVLEIKNKVAALATAASPAITAHGFLLAIGSLGFGYFTSLAVLLAFIMFKHSSDCNWNAVELRSRVVRV